MKQKTKDKDKKFVWNGMRICLTIGVFLWIIGAIALWIIGAIALSVGYEPILMLSYILPPVMGIAFVTSIIHLTRYKEKSAISRIKKGIERRAKIRLLKLKDDKK